MLLLAGYAFCAIAALSLLGRPILGAEEPALERLQLGIRDIPKLTHWLVSRQFAYIEPTAKSDEDEDDNGYADPPDLSVLALDDNIRQAGFNGRCNKAPDTCYCWWVGASLTNLGRGADLVQRPAARRFLLERTQHVIGGFGKSVGNPPDVYHTMFGLAALAVMREPGLKPFDPSLAVTTETATRIVKAREGLLKRESELLERQGQVLQMGLAEREGVKPAWLRSMEAQASN
jgi:geranylgeranyl transferase type-1 subunit beta